MPPKSNVPIRICGSKTRTGCRTCKDRHVKCDERQPICVRCQKANRQCVYDRSKSLTPKQTPPLDQQVGLTASLATHHRAYVHVSGPGSNISPYGPLELAEVNAVKGFTAHLGKELAGSFSDDVWCHILPRVAQHEPSIWHAIVAVNILDTGIRLDHSRNGESSDASLAIRQYSKAIQELQMRLGPGEDTCGKDVVLLSCILFAVFECLQNHFQSTLRHISSGLRLLIEWRHGQQSNKQDSTGCYLNRESLQPIFLLLDSQAVQMGVAASRNDFSLPAMNDQLQTPASFATVDEAHISLTHIFNRLSRWAEWVGPCSTSGNKPDANWMAREEQRLQNQLAEWDAAFDIPLKLFYPEPAILLLLVERKVIQIFFNKHEDRSSEMGWDKHLQLFQEAVEYAEAYMKLTRSEFQTHIAGVGPLSGGSEKGRPVFTVAMDIVLPLFLICAKCRDSEVRRRALRMLKVCDRKEGIWDSHVCARLAERIIELEEKGAAEDGHIPESARIFDLDVRLGEDSVGEIIHEKFVPDEGGSNRIETI